MRNTQRHRVPYISIYLVLCLWAIVCLFPLYWVAVTSLKGEWEIVKGPFYVPFGDFRPNLDAWAYVLTDPTSSLPSRFINSAIVAVCSSLLTLLIAGLAVYGVTRFRTGLQWRSAAFVLLAGIASIVAIIVVPSFLRWLVPPFLAIIALLLLRKPFFRGGPKLGGLGLLSAILATRVLPPIVIVVPVYLAATFANLLDTRSALVFVYTAANLPVAVWLLYGVFGTRQSTE